MNWLPFALVRPVGFEPTTRGLKGPCSATELRPREREACLLYHRRTRNRQQAIWRRGRSKNTARPLGPELDVGCVSSLAGEQGQGKPEGRAVAGGAVYADLATVRLDDIAGDEEAQTQPTT